LGERLAAEGGLPADDLARRPSGRVERAAADEVFARRRAEAEAAPDDWRSWFRLGIAYDDAGDRRRAREAMRRAITLSQS
jgi:Flp pilus assembly protein TadD